MRRENLADTYAPSSPEDYKALREEDRQDVKLWFRIILITLIGLASLAFVMVPEEWSHTTPATRGPAWTLLGAILGNLIRGLLD